MDEELAEEVAPLDAAEGAHLQGKEVEYLVKPDSCNLLESEEIVIPGEINAFESSFHVLGDVLEGKNVLEHGCTSPCSIDDGNDMVEELTVRNYNGSNLPMVGISNNRERMWMRQNHWQQFSQMMAGPGSGGSYGKWGNNQAMPSTSRDVGYASFSDFLGHRPLSDGRNEATEQLMSGDHNEVSGNRLSHGGIRTKILSKSGFSEFFVKTTLKGKGIICRDPSHDISRVEPRHQNNTKATRGTMVAPTPPVKAAGSLVVASNTTLILGNRTGMTSLNGIIGPRAGQCDNDGMNLREWLKGRCHKANKAECLYIFRHIVNQIDYSHSQGVILHDLYPSCFKLVQANLVKYIGSGVQNGLLDLDTVLDKDYLPSYNYLVRRRPMEQGMISSVGLCAKKQKFNESINLKRWPLFHSRAGLKIETLNIKRLFRNESCENCPNTEFSNSGSPHGSNSAQHQSISVNEQLEGKWYASPEELKQGVCTVSSNIYSLGVLLFELLCHFGSEREHAAAMLDLRHRIFPPTFLSENLKEAGFCLRLLHPEPSLRPTTRDILQSEVINGFQEVSAEELSSSINQDDTESELLLHFLSLLKEQKQNHASKLVEDITRLEADIKEIERRHRSRILTNSSTAREHRHLGKEPPISETHSSLYPSSSANEIRLMRNFNQLESAYFSMRSRVQLRETDSMTRPDKDLLKNRENWHLAQKYEEIPNPTDSLGAFFDGLCKYARYSKLEVRGMMRSGEFNNSSNVISSLSFDRDEDYFAAAGFSKKIKIFEFNALIYDSVDIHYPVIEMSNKSKLSCVCWNNYIKNYLASADYDGLVKVCIS
ncbi:hypothetical protein DITRI_Ditri04bG0135800 [Diplodiscus trichospermus]